MTDQLQPGTRILIVDDELGMREGCRRALTPLGYTVDAAPDITSGAKLMREGTYDLFLLDVMLPDGSGLDLLEPILQRDPLAVCIIITGFGSIEVAVEAIRRGAYDFLSKPFTSDELIVAVNQGLERRQLKTVEVQAKVLARDKEDLERLDELKSQFMLQVAHELRAPAAAVQSYLNLIQTGYITEDELKSTLSRVQMRLQEMLDLIADLLELARLKQARDHVAARASPQDMAGILQGVTDLFQEQARNRDQNLEVKILARPTVVANPEHLRTIWTNLISNAIKYTPQGGHIVATLRANRDRAIGVVQDSGIGIAPADQQHLFQEFYRTEQAKASGEIGTGLGLSIVKEIVDSYGGQIEVASEPGQGSRFTFSLPTEPASETDPGGTAQA